MFYVDNDSFCVLGNATEFNELFCKFFSERYLRRSFLLKLLGVILPTAILPKMNFFCTLFFSFLTNCVDQSLLDGYFYLLLSLKLLSQKKPVLLKLPHLINYSSTKT